MNVNNENFYASNDNDSGDDDDDDDNSDGDEYIMIGKRWLKHSFVV